MGFEYHGFNLANNVIATDWEVILALAAVYFEQEFERPVQDHMDLIEAIHGKLNYMETEERDLPCPRNGACSSYSTQSCSSHCNEDGKCYTSCKTVWHPCCPGHRRAIIHVYIYEIDEERTGAFAGKAIDDFITDDDKMEWWEVLTRDEYDLEEQYPECYKGGSIGYAQQAPPGTPACWPDDWGWPSYFTNGKPPISWKPKNWPALSPFIFDFEYARVCPPAQKPIIIY